LNVVEVEPAGTTMAAGVESSTLLLDSPTDAPPVGAFPARVTEHALIAPEDRLVGLHCSEANPAGKTVSVAVLVPPRYAAEIVTLFDAPTAAVVILNAAEADPPATVTLAGVAATLGFELVNATTAPPAGAGLLSITVFAVVTLPPTTVLGDTLTEARLTHGS